MLKIYQSDLEFSTFCEKIYLEYYGENISFAEIEINYDILILNKDSYKVEDIEEYIKFFMYKPYKLKRKIAFINNFDKVDLKAQNKLLKLFEENLENHILLTNNINKILPTIISRATIINEVSKNKSYEEYPKRLDKVINTIRPMLKVEELEVYLKLYDILIVSKYSDAYIYLTTLEDYNEDVVYEIIQLCITESLSSLLELQQKLYTRTNKKMQIENFLLMAVKKNENNS